MIKTITAFTLLACLLAIVPIGAAAPPPANTSIAIPISGSNTLGSFTGTYTPTSFALRNGQLVALGTVSGTLTTAAGATTGILQNNIVAPVANATGDCTILHLVLGPIDLNLLGLRITTNQIVLDITAQSGPGNLLGNLLCAVANLLNSPNQTLVNLLNQILSILNGA